MKTKYQKPGISVIQFDAEDAVMLSVSNTTVDTNKDDFDQRSNRMDDESWDESSNYWE